MSHSLRYAAVGLVLSLAMFVGLPLQAQAVSYTYDFTSGPLNGGWFTYDCAGACNSSGTFTAWDFNDTIASFQNPGNTGVNGGLALGFNDVSSFLQPDTVLAALPYLSLDILTEGTGGQYYWFAEYDTTNGCTSDCGINQSGTGNFSVRTAAVPLPSTFWPFVVGFLALVGYDWRQRRQAGLQVG